MNYQAYYSLEFANKFSNIIKDKKTTSKIFEMF